MNDNEDDIGAAGDGPAVQISAALKIPPFWANRPDLWFLQVETQFRLKGITSAGTKYDFSIISTCRNHGNCSGCFDKSS